MLKASLIFKNNRINTESEVGKFIDRSVKKSARVMERNIKVNTPVKEGHLKRSITTRDVSYGNSEVFNAPVEGGKEINYALFIEYGTKYIAPRAMFRKGVAQSEEKIKQIFSEEAKKVHDSIKGVK